MADPDAPPSPSITVRPHGPYIVTGAVPVRRRRQVTSEHGEPLTWQTTEELPTGSVAVLCRCGGSAGKPFCDGTHARDGFDGTEAAPTSTFDDRARAYEGTRVVVRDDRTICEHAGFCGNRETNVWKLVGGSGTDDSIVRGQVMAMVERCPSGALTYRLEPDGPDVEPDFPLSIGVVDDGPLFVTGGLPVVRADGAPFESRSRMTLCRCGASSIKPLCDGSHRQVGFLDRGSTVGSADRGSNVGSADRGSNVGSADGGSNVGSADGGTNVGSADGGTANATSGA